jgi:hypothetical protein
MQVLTQFDGHHRPRTTGPSDFNLSRPRTCDVAMPIPVVLFQQDPDYGTALQGFKTVDAGASQSEDIVHEGGPTALPRHTPASPWPSINLHVSNLSCCPSFSTPEHPVGLIAGLYDARYHRPTNHLSGTTCSWPVPMRSGRMAIPAGSQPSPLSTNLSRAVSTSCGMIQAVLGECRQHADESQVRLCPLRSKEYYVMIDNK